jgi:hypothetical protein
MRKNRLTLLAYALTLALAPMGAANAEWRATPSTGMGSPEAVQAFNAYLDDFDARYPNVEKVDIDAVIEAEGEKIATLYCGAIGIEGPCQPESEDGEFVPLAADARAAVPWWWWIWNFTVRVGVIPQTGSCGPYTPVVMHMDDAAPPSIWGWQGATLTGADTTWRLCRLNFSASWQFRQLNPPSLHRDYAVQRFGLWCPPGGSPVWRYQNNLPVNGNFSIGPIFPNVMIAGGGWLSRTCHFDSALPGATMAAFPTLPIPSGYGVYASRGLFQPYYPSLGNGYVYQRDVPVGTVGWGPVTPFNWVMQPTSNTTMRFLAKVQ